MGWLRARPEAVKGQRKGPPELRRFIALMILPSAIVMAGVVLYPLIRTLLLSFYQVELTRPALGRPFIGLANYVEVLRDPTFLQSAGRTLYFTVVSTVLEVVLGLAVALLLNSDFRGKGVLKALIILPWALPTVVNGAMWRWIYNPQYGALNGLLQQVGLIQAYRSWLGEPLLAMNMVILADVWKMTPLGILLFYAALQTIPETLYESARVDGAGPARSFTGITLPLLMPTILIVLVYRTIEAFKVFDIIYVMTRGGPANGTQVVAYHTYLEAFSYLRFGRGAAIAYIVSLSILVLSALYIKGLNTEDVEY
jgi:multiple sugar transport system permease protein/N,N'-diacetylchitobiose transport system permease protein